MKRHIAFGVLASLIMALVLTTGCGSAAPTPTPSPGSSPIPTTVAPGMETPTVTAVQELALLENYAATSFFPDPIVVLKGIPVKFYFTRLHREHVNRFTIEPFFSSSDVVLPGEVAILEFLPDTAGQFKIHNVGHGFEATLIVVEDEEEARAKRTEPGIQKLALIYRLDNARTYPEQIIVEKDIPVKVYSLGLDAEHRVSVPPFYTAEAVNVGPGEISTFEFTPDQTGTFAIHDELYGIEATLIVR